MRLTRLDLSGFKSFADATALPFEDGITCIVGPNGCGKSNVSDAVRWVLGEQRARMLRGQRMEEVIFQGSANRPPLNVAEVALVFDNEDETLPLPYREVALTRRLSRGGQSDYLINQTPSRLKDVQDLLRGTGLGSDAGVVIEARMVDRLLSDKAEERRSLFEEAAGIGLYRDRKMITERRLSKTLDDLQRLGDIITEVHTQVRSLARQRGKAERHLKFSNERFAIVMELTRRGLADIEARRAELAADRDRVTIDLPAAREALAERERERETRLQARATAEATRTEVERRLADRRIEVERLEGDLNLARERLQNASTRRERAQEERELAEDAATRAEREQEAATQEWEAARAARESVQGELDLRTANEDETRSRLTHQREQVRSIEDALQQAAEAHRALAGERSALERELEDVGGQLTERQHQLARAREERDRTTEAMARARTRFTEAEETERRASAALDQARHAVASTREHEVAVRAEQRRAEETVAQLTARREALEALERDRAGLAPATRQLLSARERFSAGAVVGPLTDFLSTSTADARLTERLLTESLHAVVVRDLAAVDEIRSWHAETAPGPLLLLPLQPGPTGNGSTEAPFPVEAAPPAGDWARALLKGFETLDPEGQAIRRPNGSVVLAGQDDAAGPLRRRAELEDLARRVTEARTALERLATAVTEAEHAHTEAETALGTAHAAADAARLQYQDARGSLDDAQREHQRAERDVREGEDMVARLSERLESRTGRHDAVVIELASVERERAERESALATERARLMEMEALQETAREQRVHWQVEEAQVSARERAARERAERAERALARARSDMERLAAELGDLDGSARTLNTQQQQWADRIAELRVEIGELEAATATAERDVTATAEALAACEQQIEELRTRVSDLNEMAHRLELESTEIRGRRQALTERVEAEWHRPLDELLAAATPLEGDLDTLNAEAERLAQVLESMGPVNPLAAQEYEEEKTRLEFLQTQRDDLSEARLSLEQSLREIDQTARDLFQEAFSAIREHFQRVFQTLFEGGECDLGLADPSDPLGTDIEIKAAPRGKRTQRIHLLSSGERALVALSLLFAIYLAKPSPFCLLDEVDAPLDDANVQRFIRLLSEFKQETQFIVITHNPRTMQIADAVYGVTMQEPGVSTIVGVRLGAYETV